MRLTFGYMKKLLALNQRNGFYLVFVVNIVFVIYFIYKDLKKKT